MGLFDKALKKGIGDALGKAASELTNNVSQQMNQQRNQMNQQGYQNQGYQNQGYQNQGYQSQPNPQAQQAVNQFASNLETMFSGLTKSVQNYATEMSKNLKVCPSCGKPCSADIKFCDNCGAELPEESLAQGAVCPSCGKQNPLGTKFCQDCGTKLPHAVQEEQKAQARDAEVMAEWDQRLPMFPKWDCGGSGFDLEEMDNGMIFRVKFMNESVARSSILRYRDILNQNGYRPAGQYPSADHLYQMIGSTCYHVDLEHCFESTSTYPSIYFGIGEPYGGFNYVKSEPKRGGFDFKKLF